MINAKRRYKETGLSSLRLSTRGDLGLDIGLVYYKQTSSVLACFDLF